MGIRVMSDKKKCFKCGEIKPLSAFYRHKKMADGRVNKCKECNKVDVQKNYRANIEHYKEYEKGRANLQHRVEAREEYAQTDEGKKALARGRKAWEGRNPIKKGASTMVGNAIRDGKLIKPDNCSKCGNTPSRLHGHHDDYAFPLTVRWLCPGCHTQWHRDNGEALNG